MFDQLLADVRATTKALADGDAREASRSSQILVHLLRAEDRYGEVLRAADALDRSASGITATDDELASLAAGAGARSDAPVLRYLLRRRYRQRALWRTLLDRRGAR